MSVFFARSFHIFVKKNSTSRVVGNSGSGWAVENLGAFYVRLNEVHPLEIAGSGTAAATSLRAVGDAPARACAASSVNISRNHDLVVILCILDNAQADLLEVALTTRSPGILA